jgi:DNA-binding IclR family transcriptional regulator
LSVPGISAIAAPIFECENKISITIGLLGGDNSLLLPEDSVRIKLLPDCAAQASERLTSTAAAVDAQTTEK